MKTGWGRRGGRWTAWKDRFEAAGLDPGTAAEAARFTEIDKAVEAARRGEGGKHARSTVGMASRPNRMTVQIECFVALKDGCRSCKAP